MISPGNHLTVQRRSIMSQHRFDLPATLGAEVSAR
ncbi:MAG: hypothetical protein QOI02_1124 [Actinomycetota bacterium]|nr:hypothetical protein [Actinomycetota bacterium]